MKNTLLALFILLGGFAQAQCSKDLEKHEQYSSGPIIHSKDVIFHAPTISNNKDIAFYVKDSSRMFVHFDITYGTWRVGSKVEFTFESGRKVETYISKWESEVKGSYSAKRYDCQIMSRDDIDRFYLENVQKITVHCVGRTFELSKRKRKKLNEYFQCAANTVGIENINYHPAEKMNADPYNENTIVVSFGNENNAQPTFEDINCEYEKNEVDEFTGDKNTLTKLTPISDKLKVQIHHIKGKTFLNFYYDGVLGCSNPDSYIYFKFKDASTEKFMNVGKEDCGENPMLKIEITDKISILKVRDIEKIRVGYSDAHADVTVKKQQYIRGVLNKCI